MASSLIANSTNANGFVTLSGLTSNGVYNLYTYNAGDQNEPGGRTSAFTVNGVTQTSTYDGATSTLSNGVDYLEFAGIVASGTGTLTINFGNLGVSESDFNGFQLQPVPAQILNVNFIDDSINVDYGGGNAPAPAAMAGAAVIGAAGDTWNGLGGFTYATYPTGATFTSGTLLYANGGASGITLSLSAPSGTYDANAPVWGNHSPFSWASLADETGAIGYPATPYAALMASSLIANSTNANGFVTLSGLTSNGVYNLYTYNAGDQNEPGGRTSAFTVNGVTQTSTYDGATSTLSNGVDYLEFAGIVASGTGTLTINFGNLGVSESDFNGFQLQGNSSSGPPPPVPPTVSTISPNEIILCTNTTLTCTATSSSNTITNVQMILTTSTLGGTGSTTVTNTLSSPAVTGLGTGTASINYRLTNNLIYNVTVVATDDNSLKGSAKASFDTLTPTLVIEAEDCNFNGGAYTNTPPDGGLSLYAGLVGTQTIDENKASSAGTTDNYRGSGDAIITQGAAPVNGKEQKYVTAAANGDTNPLDVPQEVGYNSVGDWLDYTRTFGADPSNSAPTGTYAIWARLATQGSGPALNFYQVTGGQGTASQTTSQLGSFSFTDNNWNGYDYVPMLDQFGNLVSVTLNGPETFRSQIAPGGNPNIDFYMLVPAVPILTPALQFAYPDGVHPFESTTNFTFTVGPANGSNIVSSGIDVVLNGVDITSNPKLSLTAAGSSWTGSFPVASNTIYAAVIYVTNTAGLFSTLTINFDTFDVNNYQWECVDYDFSTNGTTGGLFIDNPVPTCDVNASQVGTEATNSYFAYPGGLTSVALALQGVDMNWADPQTMNNSYYRADSVGTQPSGDYVRPQFVAARTQFSDPNIGPFQIGYFNQYNWLNYTRHYPTNNYNVWARLAGGGGAFSNTVLSIVTNGYGTANQSSNVLGTFSDPLAAGWQTYHWVPLLDTNGNKVVVALGGQATLTLTSGNNLNAAYFMLVPAPPQLQVTPSLVSGQLNLSFPTESGHTYKVVYKSSLSDPTWTPVGSAISGNGSVTNVIESLTGTQGYYTVTVQ
jgi:hypothetical protein